MSHVCVSKPRYFGEFQNLKYSPFCFHSLFSGSVDMMPPGGHYKTILIGCLGRRWTWHACSLDESNAIPSRPRGCDLTSDDRLHVVLSLSWYVLHERTTSPLWVDILNSSRRLSNLVFWMILSARKEAPNFGHLSQRNWHKWTTALFGPVKGTHWDIFVTVYVLLARVVLVYQKAIVCCEDKWKRVWKVFPSIVSTADLYRYRYMIDWSLNTEDRLFDWRCAFVLHVRGTLSRRAGGDA